MKRANRRKQGWEPGSPVIHLHQVWEYLVDRLRYFRRELSRCKAQYYGVGGDEENHGLYVCSLLKNTTNNYDVVNQVLRQGGNKGGTEPELVDWAHSFRSCRERLVKLDHACTEDLYNQYMLYCSNYQAIGVNDDRLFTHYRAKINSVKKFREKISLMLGYLQLDSLPVHRSEIPMDLLQCECHSGHTIARLLPATINSLEDYLEKFYDWLSLDKCYIDDLQKNIDKTRKQLKTIDKQQKISLVMYNTANTSLRKEKLVLDTLKLEFTSFDMRELRNHERQCHRLRLEILALENALNNLEKEESRDVPDCCIEELENLDEACGISQCDKDYYQRRLESKKLSLGDLTERMDDYNSLCSERSNTEKQVRVLTKNLSKARRQRDKLIDLRDSCHDKLVTLEQILENRVRPDDTQQHEDWNIN